MPYTCSSFTDSFALITANYVSHIFWPLTLKSCHASPVTWSWFRVSSNYSSSHLSYIQLSQSDGPTDLISHQWTTAGCVSNCQYFAFLRLTSVYWWTHRTKQHSVCIYYAPVQRALSDDAVWRLSVWRLSRTSGRLDGAYWLMGPGSSAWPKAAAARFRCRPGRGISWRPPAYSLLLAVVKHFRGTESAINKAGHCSQTQTAALKMQDGKRRRTKQRGRKSNMNERVKSRRLSSRALCVAQQYRLRPVTSDAESPATSSPKSNCIYWLDLRKSTSPPPHPTMASHSMPPQDIHIATLTRLHHYFPAPTTHYNSTQYFRQKLLRFRHVMSPASQALSSQLRCLQCCMRPSLSSYVQLLPWPSISTQGNVLQRSSVCQFIPFLHKFLSK